MSFEPRIVAFLCNWCAYAAADQAGRNRVEYPQSLLTVRDAALSVHVLSEELELQK